MSLQHLADPLTGSGYARELGWITHERRVHRSTPRDKTRFTRHQIPFTESRTTRFELTCNELPAPTRGAETEARLRGVAAELRLGRDTTLDLAAGRACRAMNSDRIDSPARPLL